MKQILTEMCMIDLKSGPASGQKQEKSGTSFTDESSDD